MIEWAIDWIKAFLVLGFVAWVILFILALRAIGELLPIGAANGLSEWTDYNFRFRAQNLLLGWKALS